MLGGFKPTKINQIHWCVLSVKEATETLTKVQLFLKLKITSSIQQQNNSAPRWITLINRIHPAN